MPYTFRSINPELGDSEPVLLAKILFALQAGGGTGGAFLPITGGTLTGPLILVGPPTGANEAVTKNYVDAGDANQQTYSDATFVRIDGASAMTGALNLNTHLINNVVDPVAAQDAATKNYVDTAVTGVTPPFIDSTALVKGSADATKLLRFEVDGFTAATTRVLTPPNEDGTIEITQHKDAASGYAGLTAATKLNLAQAQEVIALSDLTDVTTVTVTKGNLLAASGATWDDLAVGTDGQVLQADTASALGVKWATISTGTTFADNVFRVTDNGDATKQLAFEVSGVTTGTTRTLTIPNVSSTIEVIANKDAASGYAGLTAGTKLNLAQMQEVMGLSDLTDVTTVTATKGDLLVADGTNFDDLAVGANTSILVADSAQTLGVRWSNTEQSVRVSNSANQSIPDNTNTTITFDSEVFDNGGLHSTVTNTSRLTALVAGRYTVIGHAAFAANSTGVRAINIVMNGTDFKSIYQLNVLSALDSTFLQISTLVDLAVNDYVELVVSQNSGGALNSLAIGSITPAFSMFLVFPK